MQLAQLLFVLFFWGSPLNAVATSVPDTWMNVVVTDHGTPVEGVPIKYEFRIKGSETTVVSECTSDKDGRCKILAPRSAEWADCWATFGSELYCYQHAWLGFTTTQYFAKERKPPPCPSPKKR